jgi:hypothetical protein
MFMTQIAMWVAARSTGAVRCRGRRNNSTIAMVEESGEATSSTRRFRFTRPLSVSEFDPSVRRPKMRVALVSIAFIGSLLGGCVGHPIPIPYPQSELGPPPGMPGASELSPTPGYFTGDSGEWVIYRQK